MANEALRTFLRHLRRVADLQGPDRPTDAELLDRFAVARDQGAFELLVWRHGPMVLNLCRNLLRHEHDAEDAFQATFLTLVRKAGSIVKKEAVGSWLYKVAYRIALEANAHRAKRAERESTGVEALAARPAQDLAECDFQLALGEEVNRLPDKYRVPLVLHCFEGRTSQEVAQQLGCAEATVRTRLARARARLRTRLVRRGLALSTGILAAELSPSPLSGVPAALVDLTVKAAVEFAAGNAVAAGVASGNATVLAERALRLMFLNKLKQMAAMVVLVGVFGSGAGLSLHQALAEKPAAQEKEKAPRPDTKEAHQPKDDRLEIRGTWETWETETITATGELPKTRQVKRTCVITNDKILHVGEDGLLDQEMTFKLDPTQRPKAIDLTYRSTGTALGIYELEGDTLKIGYGGYEQRPTEFWTKPGMATVLKRVSRTFAPVPQRFANPPGCFWMIRPQNPSVLASFGGVGIIYFYDKEQDGAVVITLAYLTPNPEAREYRPVLFDAGRKRYLPKGSGGGYSGGRRGEGMVSLQRWRMDPKILPAEQVEQIGIEAVTSEVHRQAAREALERAKSAHLEVLPWPEVGKPYLFTLTTIDGRKIRSEDLKGKVVLLDCWATWCSPCMALMPELKELYKKWHPKGLEIVGISLDHQVEIVQKLCKAQALTWPQVLVPHEESVRTLWEEASGISGIPRVLLIDQQGVLRADSGDKLEERITKLLTNSSDKPAVKSRP
jgi:RNA polymerase sigma factor (sigma-70 family)